MNVRRWMQYKRAKSRRVWRNILFRRLATMASVDNRGRLERLLSYFPRVEQTYILGGWTSWAIATMDDGTEIGSWSASARLPDGGPMIFVPELIRHTAKKVVWFLLKGKR